MSTKNGKSPNDRIKSDQTTAWQLFDCLDAEIFLVSKEGLILFANQSAINRLGNSMVGLSVWENYSNIEKIQLKSLFDQVISSKKTQFLRIKKKNQWQKISISPVVDEQEEIASLVFFIQNITEFTQNEELLKKTILELATVQEDERQRISRDLHDEIGQRMTVLLMQLRAISEIVKSGNKIALEEINSASQNLDIIIKHLRQIFFQLYPPALNKVSLSKILAALCSSIEETNNLQIDLSCQENIPDLLESQVTTVYRFVQEGLTNIIKHAKATSAWINLDYSEGELNISIEDDGQGFSVQDTQEGVGLRGLRKRFQMLNGSFQIETSPKNGTRLSGSIPVEIKPIAEDK